MPTIKTATGPAYSKLLSVAGVRGNRVVDNEEMCTYIDSSDEWIQQRTGIVERRWVDETQTALSMATEAGAKAIERAGLNADEIDAVIISTVSHFKQTPSLAVEVAHGLGLSDPAAYDISAACAGFCYGIGQADAMVRGGLARNVLLIGVEALSMFIDLADRSTAFLFSDGAGAVVVGGSDEPSIGPTVWGSDGSQAPVIDIRSWDSVEKGDIPKITMEGRAVFKWATTAIAEKTHEALAAAGLQPEDLQVFVPHQANNRITDSMLRHLKLPEGVVVARDITHMGNSSAASVPLAMEALLDSGAAKSGDIALTIGFGAGLVYAGQVLRLP
ncbi:beta-ketoacyl-ACP synthase III [Propionibacteriaceae bacterium Y1923]|uniref:beta-ketoacyl-ACP synthase III n=1 Tax=Aestuariimicrobium sp. Y1814 TaxID=3418742 RepID=UPI003C2186F9